MSSRGEGSAGDLLIVGGGGLAREVIWLARDCRPAWNVIGILDDSPRLQGQRLCNVPVLGPICEWRRHPNVRLVVAIGDPRVRQAVVQRLSAEATPNFATLIHPSVLMSEYVELGAGSIVAAGCILTTQVRIGRHVVLDRMVNAGHDVTVADFCTVSPMALLSGNVILAAGVWVGAAASIRQGLRIGQGSMVGMGAAVVGNVMDNELVAGVPARRRRGLPPFMSDSVRS